jgi:hypothetical protein
MKSFDPARTLEIPPLDAVASRRFRCFTLPIAQSGRLLKLLAREGVTAASVLPGYDGVVEAVRERELWIDR